ncbi:phosphoesterase RecJ domain-containing protein [Spiroplasma syrphidicola EA-1]|uniref:Phosphoesterase RecJ domain-containing protein n=1 Tax=Spiroplasma syrphidicola EA-1 TaxID=1276229 RepID=R4UMY3_9MOLU|nr:bifunctional oligoribonuclease/PAP phosphatase NrnA [Spiroplasma syrphidicola]AGM26596.1 phosphoesterase RecJ domain-containing protein [Spiroplasma syrphidicola EA-1]
MFEQLLKILKEHDNFIILRHIEPDCDALGSQLGLKALLNDNFPTKKVLVGGKLPTELSFIGQMDQLQEKDFKDAVVLITDTATTGRIDLENEKWLTTAKLVVKIDHHPNLDQYGDVMVVDASYPATCELLTDFITTTNLKLSPTAAHLLFLGLVTDTERFLYRSVSERTFAMAYHLTKAKFDLSAAYDEIYAINPNLARLKGYILSNFTLTPEGLAYIKITKELLKEFKAQNPHQIALWVNILGDIKGAKIWMMFVESKDYIRIEFRSRYFAVNKIASKFNGGGHQVAAGAKVYDWASVELVIQEATTLLK